MSTFAGSKVRHGTASGWSMHQQLQERPCDPCYAAKAEYDKRRRQAPSQVKQSRIYARAQGRAESELARRHPDEYRELYEKYKAEILAEEAPE